VLLTRSGPLPGAADWSHAEANAASTGASADRIRNPTEILWFNANRWDKSKGKNVRVSGGRLVFLVEELMWATDVYTGRKLWEVELSEEEKDHQGIHHILARRGHPTPKTLPPATQLVVVEDAIYLAQGSICRVFEPATGKETGQLRMPGALEKTSWENLRVHNEYLVSSSGKHVLCMNRRTGRQLWRVEASHAPLYLAVGGDKVFCAGAHIFALDLASGKQVWQQRSGKTKLRYCPTLDILVTSNGLYRGTNGEPLKRPVDTEGKRIGLILNDLSGHLLRGNPEKLLGFIAGEKLLLGDRHMLQIYDLRSAKPVGKVKLFPRGCTSPKASTFLYTARDRGYATWMDLDRRELTRILGIRPVCKRHNVLYPANGVLNAPNLTAWCGCNYLPISMALVPGKAFEPVE